MLIQILFSALYTKLIETAKIETATEVPVTTPPIDDVALSKATICNILAEGICSIDEDNKHTDAINNLINQAKISHKNAGIFNDDPDDTVGISIVSTVKVF